MPIFWQGKLIGQSGPDSDQVEFSSWFSNWAIFDKEIGLTFVVVMRERLASQVSAAERTKMGHKY